jgi:hypothetical protein
MKVKINNGIIYLWPEFSSNLVYKKCHMFLFI